MTPCFCVGHLRQPPASQPDWLAVRRNVRDRLRPQKTASFSIAFLSFLSFPPSLPALLPFLVSLFSSQISPLPHPSPQVNVFTLFLTSSLLSLHSIGQILFDFIVLSSAGSTFPTWQVSLGSSPSSSPVRTVLSPTPAYPSRFKDHELFGGRYPTCESEW
jgi:hypothetical protein